MNKETAVRKLVPLFSREKSRQTFVIKSTLSLFLYPNPFVIKKAISQVKLPLDISTGVYITFNYLVNST